jgi:hypothetical protein
MRNRRSASTGIGDRLGRNTHDSAAAQYALSAPFTERFFDMAGEGGFVGLINSNAWMKRDFGKALIQKVLPRHDLQKVIDTSGCYIPGHGTPTLLLFGRHRKPSDAAVVAVLGKRGEQEVPQAAAAAPVWSEIAESHAKVGHEGASISVEAIPRADLARHPWVMSGGGARSMLGRLEASASHTLAHVTDDIGFSVIIGEDEAFLRPSSSLRGLASSPVVVGDAIRDWQLDLSEHVLRPFRWADLSVEGSPAFTTHLWPWRRRLEERIVSGSTSMKAAKKEWFDLRRLSRSKHQTPLAISFSFVATHNHYVLSRGGMLFNRSAPIIKLRKEATLEEHQSLLGYLNSSIVAFWCRLVMFPKGGDQVGEGARLSKTPWQDRLEYAGNLLQQLPVPKLEDLKTKLLDLVVAAEETVAKMAEHAADKVVATTLANTPTLAALRDARTKGLAERARLRGVLVSLQEEIDWRVYGLFGLPTVEAPSLETVRVPVEPNHRPFEVRLAREVATDISASEALHRFECRP